MNKEAEEYFVRNFIVKEKRERLLFELSGKKRRDGIGRFCHSAEDLLIADRIGFSGKLPRSEIESLLTRYGDINRCFIISYDKAADGKCCGLEEALDLVLGGGMAAVIISGSAAFIETEQCCGTPERYIVVNDIKNCTFK